MICHAKKCCIVCAATVVLDSRQACPWKMVTYICTVNQGFTLDWIVEPFLNGSARIRFLLGSTPIGRSVNCSDVSPPQCGNIDFVATFTNTANPMTVQGGTLADMTSTLAFTAASRLNGTVVQCRGSTAVGFLITNRTLNIAGASVLQQHMFRAATVFFLSETLMQKKKKLIRASPLSVFVFCSVG